MIDFVHHFLGHEKNVSVSFFVDEFALHAGSQTKMSDNAPIFVLLMLLVFFFL